METKRNSYPAVPHTPCCLKPWLALRHPFLEDRVHNTSLKTLPLVVQFDRHRNFRKELALRQPLSLFCRCQNSMRFRKPNVTRRSPNSLGSPKGDKRTLLLELRTPSPRERSRSGIFVEDDGLVSRARRQGGRYLLRSHPRPQKDSENAGRGDQSTRDDNCCNGRS